MKGCELPDDQSSLWSNKLKSRTQQIICRANGYGHFNPDEIRGAFKLFEDSQSPTFEVGAVRFYFLPCSNMLYCFLTISPCWTGDRRPFRLGLDLRIIHTTTFRFFGLKNPMKIMHYVFYQYSRKNHNSLTSENYLQLFEVYGENQSQVYGKSHYRRVWQPYQNAGWLCVYPMVVFSNVRRTWSLCLFIGRLRPYYDVEDGTMSNFIYAVSYVLWRFFQSISIHPYLSCLKPLNRLRILPSSKPRPCWNGQRGQVHLNRNQNSRGARTTDFDGS